MKPGVMRSSRNWSARRPSVRAKVSSAGLKLIVPPDLDGFEPARRGAEEALGDVREALGRVGHVEVVEVVAQVLFGDRARHVRLGPALLGQRDEERAGALEDFHAGRERADGLAVGAAL